MQAGSTPQQQDYFADVSMPSSEDLSYQIQQLVQQGVLTPEQAEAALVNSSAMESVQTDPSLKSAQMEALMSLQDLSEGGMTDMDRANLAKISAEEAASARGAREAILQGMEARGAGGSGASLLAQLQNAQDAATRKSARDTEVAGQASQRALEALQQAGTQAGNIRGQDFSEQAAKAEAADAIAKFNAANKQQVNLTNTAAKNDAAAKNLAVKQGISDANANLQTQQNAQKAQIAQQQYENELKKRSGQAGIGAANQQAAGANSAANANAMNQTVGTGLTVASMFSDERGKEGVEEFNASDFLDTLTNYKYKYKDQKHGVGDHMGPMAQDLEKSDIGAGMIMETPEGKMVDTRKASMAALGSLADMNQRLKKLEGK